MEKERPMPASKKSLVRAAIIIIAFFSVTPIRAQQSAPIPSPIPNAKKVFIANAGADALVAALDQGKGTGDRFYNIFYAAMKTWGHYELLDSPAGADLVLEI